MIAVASGKILAFRMRIRALSGLMNSQQIGDDNSIPAQALIAHTYTSILSSVQLTAILKQPSAFTQPQLQ